MIILFSWSQHDLSNILIHIILAGFLQVRLSKWFQLISGQPHDIIIDNILAEDIRIIFG